MSTNFIHHEISRIRKERTRIYNKMELMDSELVSDCPLYEHLGQRYFDLTTQENHLEQLL